MTYNRLMATVEGLLTGDLEFPEKWEVQLGLVEMAFGEIAIHAEALHLMTLNRNNSVTRLATGNYVVRTPKLPTDGTDLIDLDAELCPALARLLASYVSKEDGPKHANLARRLITDYNASIYELLESVNPKGGTCYDV